ncbi:eukaryotic translation initiation factor 2D isoform X2 [Maniola jurtina]|uniref:eukaryotic translation initiation factor 2D isoform X2 n=2 Tax=Maniola jurtina TaxID=191418 RepID=UPI001E686071|nr:eukaryotic translation initiation factor 2D isoform X2 [Maniola jurtina]
MFGKPYRLKSNKTLKNTEKKYLTHRIQSEFSVATDEKVKELVPAKSATSCMKVVLHSGDTVAVYVVDGVPIMIDVGDRLVPTVCALWKVPDFVPTITIHSPVLNKMQGGVPLYAPGVVTEGSFPQFQRGAVVAACTSDNAAVGVIGHAMMSSADLVRAPMGVCLETLHVYGDQLCKEEKFSKIERPKLGPASYSDLTDNIAVDFKQLNIQPIKEEWPSLVRIPPTPVANEPVTIPDLPVKPEPMEQISETQPEDEVVEELNESGATDCSEAEDEVPSDMDGLLRWCLLSFLKTQAKHVELPLKTNLLYKNHLMPFCPADRTLEVKKSSFKKMGKFLEAMQREGLVEVREIDKGVDALVSVNTAHPLVRAHRARAPQSKDEPERDEHEYVPPQIRELYCITANVVELFAPLRKGTALTAADVRQAIVQHVTDRKLTHPQARGCVTLDHVLAAATGKQPQELMKWEELTTCVLGRMTPSTETRFSDGTVKLTKSRLEPIKMQVVTRSGNKKVTLVSNLESFGFSLRPLAHACQLLAGAACGTTRSAASKTDQLMLQGDQTHLVAKLLIEKYGLPKKFVEGADKALNKKK